MNHGAFAIVAALVSIGSALADTPKIDRSIGKEPVYKTKSPKYGLLAFGPEGKDRVWFVQDGDTLYVDRNGNGDLTEPDKKVAAKKRRDIDLDDERYSFNVGELKVGGRTHKGLAIWMVRLDSYVGYSVSKRPDVQFLLIQDRNALIAGVSVDVEVPGMKGGGLEGRIAYTVGPYDVNGVLQLADKPADAPVIRLGGPLQITIDNKPPTFRIGRQTDLTLAVGTPGVGPGTFAAILYSGTIPEDVKPVVEAALPRSSPTDPPLVERWIIESRC